MRPQVLQSVAHTYVGIPRSPFGVQSLAVFGNNSHNDT